MFQFKERRRVWPDVSPKRMHRRTTSSREDARRNQPSGRQKQSRGEMARRTRCDGSEAGAAGRRPGRAAAGVARCSWERGRRSGCEDKFLGFDAESPRVRKSKDGCAHSRVSRTAERWKQPQRPSSREGRTRGAVAAAKSGEAPTLATVWTDPEHTTLARDAGHTGPHGARLHRCDAPRQARAQTGSEWADVRGWGRLLADRDRVFFVV